MIIKPQFLDKPVIEFVKKLFPIVGRKNSLVLNSIDFKRDENAPSDLEKQKDAKVGSKDFSQTIYADVSLKDDEDRIVERSKVPIMKVPTPTERGTYILDGNEYFIVNEMRSKPGIYSTTKPDGKISARINFPRSDNNSRNSRQH